MVLEFTSALCSFSKTLAALAEAEHASSEQLDDICDLCDAALASGNGGAVEDAIEVCVSARGLWAECELAAPPSPSLLRIHTACDAALATADASFHVRSAIEPAHCSVTGPGSYGFLFPHHPRAALHNTITVMCRDAEGDIVRLTGPDIAMTVDPGKVVSVTCRADGGMEIRFVVSLSSAYVTISLELFRQALHFSPWNIYPVCVVM